MSLVFASFNSPEGYVVAGALILLAALLDGLDGQVARWLGIASTLGKELDSLADCVTFGVSPGYLAYKAYLFDTGVFIAGHPVDLGIPLTAIFPICAAYRLARYNIQSAPGSFTGLPSTVAGSLVALVPLCFPTTAVPKLLFAGIFLLVALLMVSTIGYSKPQSFIFKNVRGFKLAGLITLVVLLLLRFGFRIILLFVALYVLSGLVRYVIKLIEEHRY